MRGNKSEKSHIHMQSETLSRESRITESAQEIVGSIPCNCELYSYITPVVNTFILFVGKKEEVWV